MAGQCQRCGYTTVSRAGIDCYAPEFIDMASGFKAEYFADLFNLESGNFWFKARNQLIVDTLSRHCGQFDSFLEIGCGTGFVLSGLKQRFPEAQMVGSEIFLAGLEFAAKRVPEARFLQMDARNNPYLEEFDVVGAFDVIEHIEEDVRVMKQVYSALRPGGYFLITVPQHKWLWSQVDEYAQHVRRYSKVEVHEKLINAGFKIVRSSSFVSTLLPAMFASRLISRRTPVEEFDPFAEFNIPYLLNQLLWFALRVEVSLIGLGLNLPIGGTRMVLAQKN
jgi:SAM-dependent methyltransferase